MESITNENWCIPCIADGEESKPSPMELESMYQRLETGEVFELSWRNPGRRLPSSTTKDENETPENANIDTSTTNVEFDFMDDATPTSAIRVRTSNSAPKGSAKKKTANFSSVIDAMKKNKRTSGPLGTPTSSRE